MRLQEIWIPMPDGVRLAANLFLPPHDERGRDEPLPVLLEYLPYRKDDGLFERDWDLYSYMTARGFACVKVDIRGTGRSQGIPPDREYSEGEQRDGEAVIAWLGAQPWSNGSVGMWGISWGGFNSIQMAMRPTTPGALKAILAIDASDDLFHDDVHYIDGLLHIDEYAVMIDLEIARSRAPDFPLDEGTLAARFDRPPSSLLYLRNQRAGPFWRRASLAPGYERLRLPALLIGGWYDGYRDSVFRMLEHCRPDVPIKGMVGPWNHTFPHDASPGPEIEWRHEACRWFDRWLRDEPNGIEDEPRLAVYVQRPYPPGIDLKEIPGQWRLEEGWPLARGRDRSLGLCADGSLAQGVTDAGSRELTYLPSGGAASGMWWGELWPDQRDLDSHALVYETAPLTEGFEIMGMPWVGLVAQTDAPLVNWFARLSDVAPDGSVTLVAGGGARPDRRGSEGGTGGVRIELHATSWAYQPGHRIRLSLSNAMWPMVWPTPFACTVSVARGQLHLPEVPFEARPVPSFLPAEPVQHPPGWKTDGHLAIEDLRYERDHGRGVTLARWSGSFRTEAPWGVATYDERLEWRVEESNPADAGAHGMSETTVELTDGRTIVWRGTLDLASDERDFHFRYGRTLELNGDRIRERSWDETVPRDGH